ncbi:MAG: hypothetical protein DRR04_12145 [Gammaproteobacteria bacterium]|nr:MAG: hypothetical protein DRR04_12145 [Gammaproteobacteria bacterium]
MDAASGDAALLPTPVDYYTTEFDVGLLYSGQRLHLDGSLAYSDFNNRDNLLRWQNPYSAFGPRVSYPEGEGGLGTAPDNTQSSARLSGQYLISTTTRIQFDGSYFVTGQDQSFEDYSINPQLLVSEPLPRDNFDGEVATSTFNAKLLMRPLAKLGLEATYKLRDRDYDTPRDGYRYIRGDGGDQPRSALTVYNTAHDYLSQAAGLELNYRLPLHSKLSLEYQYESIERKNASVEETEEDRYTLGYRIRPWSNFSAKLELSYADRAADTYHWDQAYYALLDTELINATPDSQRYLNHPQMSQFYLSNRERTEGKIDLNYMPDPFWNLNLNWLLRDDDFDKSDLGLTSSRGQGLYFNVGYTALTDFSLNFYAGYDNYNSDQGSRAFRGGQEKNAFEVVAPLPQASDPDRNWDMESNDTSVTLGANIAWQFSRELELSLDYSFVDTNSEQDFTTFGTSGLNADDLPDVETRLHHIQASGIWQLREALSIQLDYQYYRYSSDDWAWQDVQADTLGKVLTFGERNPNEQIHYVGTSVIYRWK